MFMNRLLPFGHVARDQTKAYATTPNNPASPAPACRDCIGCAPAVDCCAAPDDDCDNPKLAPDRVVETCSGVRCPLALEIVALSLVSAPSDAPPLLEPSDVAVGAEIDAPPATVVPFASAHIESTNVSF